MTDAINILELDHTFTMHRGGVLHAVEIAYETWGTLNEDRDNAVLLFTGLSPSAHAASSPADPSAGWWEDMIGCGRPIDTDDFFVVCINSLGSCFGSTGPASLNPATGKPYRLTFPTLTIEDIAQAGAEVVKSLGINRLRAVIGPSMGGMTALAYCMQSPSPPVDAFVSVSSAARALPFAIALRSLQREIIRNDPKWQQGNYEAGDGPLQGMRLARKLGMISYRSASEWKSRFGRERAASVPSAHDPFGVEFEVESYLAATANKFTGGFDANCYLYLSRAMDLFDCAEHGGSLPCAATEMPVQKALIIGAETDILFPLEQQEQLAELLREAGKEVVFHPLPSIQGHDSFLVDMDRFRPAIGEFFRGL
ncbi:MAG: homoserine O-acetyltransferase [Pseudomonadota bacterium]